MLSLLAAFESKCLAADQPATPDECKQVGCRLGGREGCKQAVRCVGSAVLPLSSSACCSEPQSQLFLNANMANSCLARLAPSQLCLDLERRLRDVYGPQLILAPHNLSAAALESQGGAGALPTSLLLRLLLLLLNCC